METYPTKDGYYLNVIEVERYRYVNDNSRVTTIIQKANEEKLNYKFVLVHMVKHAGRWYYTTVHFMNSDKQEVAYACTELFDMTGFVYFETPRVWSLEFLIKKCYFRIDRKDFNENQNIMRAEDAAISNEYFKNMENNIHYL